MSYFWDGFEKRAGNPLLGRVKGLTSGKRNFLQGGQLMPPKAPTVGQTIAPRSLPVPLGTPNASAAAKKTMAPVASSPAAAVTPKPVQTSARGVSSMSI